MADECPAYLAWIREQPCLGCGREPAGEAHHTGRKGIAQRSHDRLAVSMCHECHMALEGLSNAFKGFQRYNIKAWEQMAVEVTQLRAMGAGWRWVDDNTAVRLEGMSFENLEVF